MIEENIKMLREERKNICNNCEHKKMAVVFEICNLCKCPIFKKVKRDNGCPIGKWK